MLTRVDEDECSCECSKVGELAEVKCSRGRDAKKSGLPAKEASKDWNK